MHLKDYALVALKLDTAGRIVFCGPVFVSLMLYLIPSAPCRGRLCYHSISIFSLFSLQPFFYSHFHSFQCPFSFSSVSPAASLSLHRSTDLMTALTARQVGFLSLIPCSPISKCPVYPIITIWLSPGIVFCISMFYLMSSSDSQLCFSSTCSLHFGTLVQFPLMLAFFFMISSCNQCLIYMTVLVSASTLSTEERMLYQMSYNPSISTVLPASTTTNLCC